MNTVKNSVLGAGEMAQEIEHEAGRPEFGSPAPTWKGRLGNMCP